MRRYLTLIVCVVLGIVSLVALAADAGGHEILAGDTYTVPDTNVEITNNSVDAPVFVEWDDNSSNIRVSVADLSITSISTAGTSVSVTASGDQASVTTSGGGVNITFASGATNGSASLGDDNNVIIYKAGSSDNYAACSGNGNTHKSETDPDLVTGNETTFNGQGDMAR